MPPWTGIGENKRLTETGIGENKRLTETGIGENKRLTETGIGDNKRLTETGIGENNLKDDDDLSHSVYQSSCLPERRIAKMFLTVSTEVF
ncbi:hypothetical protein DPMN_098764 [Dreissena polymorpha]|uniref:Uncharacterized protein n=1 Tax=Dreissena polymorpha TaxID=45954 RepID=A0A9D4LFV0_DREPO|nr:hypothetical protein DPMN_098764 [Dreissena polymorpha]